MAPRKKKVVDEFALSPPPEPKKKPKRAANAKRAIDAYYQAFLARFGFKPVIHGGKDNALVEKLIVAWGEDEVLSLIPKFFTTTDPRIRRSDYTIGSFVTLAQRLRIGPTPDPRTAETLDAAAQAMGSRRPQ